MNYDNYVEGEYTNLALAGLVDAEFDFGLGLLLGLRYDTIDAESAQDPTRLLPFIVSDPDFVESASDTENGVSWNVSANYKLPGGFIPYVTVAEQSVVVAGQGAELAPSDLAGGSWFSATELTEVGIKGDFLDGRLYAAISYYDQKRTDRNIQSPTVNQDIETDGIEAEVRWAVSDKLLLTGSYTSTTVTNATYAADGSAFSFFGAEDMTGVMDHSLHYGGQPIGLNFLSPDMATRAGIPEELLTLTGTYSFDSGLSVSGSIVDVPSVYSGQSQVVELPGYTLVDLSASYEFGDWLLRASVKNATDEEYFRANFTELFGSTIVLPEKPRSFQASVIYKF